MKQNTDPNAIPRSYYVVIAVSVAVIAYHCVPLLLRFYP